MLLLLDCLVAAFICLFNWKSFPFLLFFFVQHRQRQLSSMAAECESSQIRIIVVLHMRWLNHVGLVSPAIEARAASKGPCLRGHPSHGSELLKHCLLIYSLGHLAGAFLLSVDLNVQGNFLLRWVGLVEISMLKVEDQLVQESQGFIEDREVRFWNEIILNCDPVWGWFLEWGAPGN